MPEASIEFERKLPGPNEVFAPGNGAFPRYRPVLREMERMGSEEWDRRVRRAHERMLDVQRELGISGEDKTHPADYVPRLIPPADWEKLKSGLTQRMLAINEYLRRLEAGKDEVVPGKNGEMVPAQKPVNMTFTVTAKERYLWTLELKRRGLTAVSVLRETMEDMMGEADR